MTHRSLAPRRLATPRSFWFAICAVFISLTLLSLAHAETRTVVAEGDSGKLACFSRETASKMAASGAEFNGHDECRALGKGWSPARTKFPGYSQCNACSQKGEFRCKVTQAVYECVNMDKENEAKAAKDRLGKEQAEYAANRKAELARGDAIEAALKKKKKDDEKAAQDKSQKPSVQTRKDAPASSIDDAFSKLEKRSGTAQKPKTGGIDEQFSKMETERAANERARLAAEKLAATKVAAAETRKQRENVAAETPKVAKAGAGESGAFYDARTRLLWRTDSRSKNWNDSDAYCNSQGSGWSLPTVTQLQALYDPSQSQTCDTRTCHLSSKLLLNESIVWTNEREGSSQAWSVHFDGGHKAAHNVGSPYAQALCVRRP